MRWTRERKSVGLEMGVGSEEEEEKASWVLKENEREGAVKREEEEEEGGTLKVLIIFAAQSFCALLSFGQTPSRIISIYIPCMIIYLILKLRKQ